MIYFSCPGVFKTFSKSRKNWGFPPTANLGPLLLNSHMCIFSNQVSGILYFSCPGVKIWWVSSFSKNFWKKKKIIIIEIYAHCGPGDPFLLNSHMCTFSIHMSECFYSSCPGVKIWWFSSFSKTFRKIEKIEVFAHCRPGNLFDSIHTCAHFPSKWVNVYILVVLE